MGSALIQSCRKQGLRSVGIRRFAPLSALLILSAAGPLCADSKAKGPDFRKGALYGAVVDTTTGKPIPDATIGVLAPDGKVLGWTKTNAEGKYAIAADTFAVLHLRPSHRRGLLEQICRSVGEIVTAPVRVAVGAVSRPGETLKSAAEATIMGNPTPLATQVANSLTDKARSTPIDAEKSARQAACHEIFSERQAAKKAKKPGLCPGELSLAVSAPGYKDLKSPAGAYWMEPPVEEKKKTKLGVQAWLETVRLAPAQAGDKKSEVAQEALLLADPQVEPVLAPPGATVHLSVRLKNPTGFGPKVRIFAREKKKDTVAELTAADPKQPELFTGSLTLDKGLAVGETQIAIGVLRTEPLEVKIPKAKEDPLLKFAGRLDELEAGKPFDYDPRIFACENRLDLTINILDPRQATPAAGAAPVPAPPGNTPTVSPPVPDPPGKKPPNGSSPVPAPGKETSTSMPPIPFPPGKGGPPTSAAPPLPATGDARGL
jgi:hypothetical protein